MAGSAYNDAEYRAGKQRLRTEWHHCQLRRDGCTGRATTLDHQPALSEHQHRRGATCCKLIPSCSHCNYSDGAERGNRSRSTGFDWP